MQWSLFLLILMGQCSLFTCHKYEYYFTEENKTWHEAKEYCRKNYTDLATVYDMTDMKRLRDSTKNQDEAWIGLYSNPGQKKWHWSLPGVEFSDMRAECCDSNEDHQGNCETVEKNNYKWKVDSCSETYKFVCYNEKKKSNKKFNLIDNKMTWPKAQNYCREHHTDLVSGCSHLQDEELKNEINSQEKTWIGLFRDTWRWSDGSNFSFRNWDQEFFKEDDSNKKCAMTVLNGFGKWGYDDCNKSKPFFCYDVSVMTDEVILIKEEKTWEEALNHCRSHYRDLVSITNPQQQRWVQERAKQADTEYVWLGLRYTCTMDLWFWVSDDLVCYDNWASTREIDGCGMSGAMKREKPHEWINKQNNEQFNFICAVN